MDPAPPDIYTLSLHDALPILGDRTAVLMRGHGSTVVGPNLQQAAVTAIYLEETAKLTYRARCIGTPIYFTDEEDRKSTRLNSSHLGISYAVFCLKKKKTQKIQ